MEAAIIGLIGVVLGFFLTFGRERYTERKKMDKEAQYLAIRTVCIFDRFIEGCVAVVGDDGLWHGQSDADGYSRIQEKAPTLDIELTDVNWKALPFDVMYEILSFPRDLDDANHIIDSTFEHAASPPSYDEGFEERQYQFATLGLKASSLVEKLRSTYGIPARVISTWNPIEYMENEKIKIEEIRNKRAETWNTNSLLAKKA